MNIRRRIESVPIDRAVKKDVARIEQIWADCLETYGGPFLFGDSFTIADGMYAPIVNRFAIYELSDHPATRAYSDALIELPAWREWTEASANEPWVVEIDEVYA